MIVIEKDHELFLGKSVLEIGKYSILKRNY